MATSAVPFLEKAVADTSLVVTAAATSVRQLRVDNRANTHDSFWKGYNTASATVGTTDPNMIVPAKAGKATILHSMFGRAFGTALSHGVVKTAGTPGTTAPDAGVPVQVN